MKRSSRKASGNVHDNSTIRDSILFQIAPLFLVLAVFIFTQHELIVTLCIAAMILGSFSIRYYAGEWKVLILGMLLGFTFEILGDLIYKAQYWENASLLGIPLWLPLMWGYGFIFIRRIGNMLVKPG